MAKVQFIQHGLNAGELSPLLRGRTDIAKYQKGLKTAANVISLVHGGIRRRYGTRFVAEVKTSANVGRLIPFVYSRSVAYVIELGDEYARFYTPNGQVLSGSTPYEIVTPWDKTDLFELSYTQTGSTMFVAHRDYEPKRFILIDSTEWAIRSLRDFAQGFASKLEDAPFMDLGERPNTTLTLDSASNPTSATAGAAIFIQDIISQQWIVEPATGARVQIGTPSSATVTTLYNTTKVGTFSGTVLAAGDWIIEGPRTETITFTPNATGPKLSSVTLTASSGVWKGSPTGITTDLKKDGETAEAGHNGFVALINGGAIKLDNLSSTTVATGVVLTELAGTTAARGNQFALARRAWNPVDGWPACVGLYEQRLVLANSAIAPVTLWGSAIGDLADFAIGANDDDAFMFELAADQIHEILHLSKLRDLLLVFTAGSEWSLTGSADATITPTNVKARAETAYGASVVRPVRVANEVIFVQRGNTKVRSIGYRLETDSYESPDLTILSEHVTGDGIVDMAYAEQPDYTVWCPREDGQVAVMSIERSQDVVAWTRAITDGEVESVAVIPNGSEDQIWLLVKRTIDGNTVRYVEYVDSDLEMDCAITGTSGSAQTVWSGLDHLEGETVGVIADGVYVGTKTVSSGSITLTTGALAVQIGLLPTVTVETLTPEAAPGITGTQALATSVNRVWLRVKDSTGEILVNGQPVTIATPPTLFTGDVDISNLGWSDGDGSVTITQTQPYPLTILAIIKSVSYNQG